MSQELRIARTVRISILRLAICFLAGFVAVGRGADGDYARIVSKITLVSHKTSRREASTNTYSATCIIGVNKWSIETDFIRGATEVWTYDGTNLFRSTRMLVPWTLGIGLTPVDVPPGPQAASITNSIYLRIHPGQKLEGTAVPNVAWLAFASGGYLRLPDRILSRPIGSSPRSDEDWGFADKTEVFSDNLGLPKKIEMFVSEEVAERSLRQRLRPEQVASRPRQNRLPDGQLKCRYEVHATTNFNEWTLPLKFSVVQHDRGGRGELRKYEAIGEVVSLTKESEPPSPFKQGVSHQVLDHRFPKFGDISYLWTNGYLPRISDEPLSSKIREKLKARFPTD